MGGGRLEHNFNKLAFFAKKNSSSFVLFAEVNERAG